jgi:CGNR zinc finger/Putative stress-induced transcription regulator
MHYWASRDVVDPDCRKLRSAILAASVSDRGGNVTFAHDVEHALDVVVDLVNTDPASAGEELLPDTDALHEFVVLHDLSEVDRITDEDLTAVRSIRAPLRAVFLAGSAEGSASLLNELFRSATVSPRLTDHDQYPWHIHYFTPGAAVAEHLMIDGAMALAVVVTTGEHERLQTCAAPNCERVLVDLSRNRSKRYCDSRTCGNRLHVAAYRQRRRARAS